MTAVPPLQAPFPWFGGKTRAAAEIWRRLGNPQNYVEPFAGSLAVLLARPDTARPRTETVNDLDGFIANFWRAVAADPAAVAAAADWPVNENDLHGRHAWLVGVRDSLTARLEGDPGFYDPQIAGWWVWGICAWIGSGWCSGAGPWISIDGQLTKTVPAGQGIKRQLPHLGGGGMGITRKNAAVEEWFNQLSGRLRDVRVASGDWTRVMGDSVTTNNWGSVGIVLDPPYSDTSNSDLRVYGSGSGTVAHDVHNWCLKNGHRTDLRIAYCGYADAGHDNLTDHGWTRHNWTTGGGYGGGRGGQADTNRTRETIWFSPHCLNTNQAELFEIPGR